MATPKMMCPACLGHGKFADNTLCTVCRGQRSVTETVARKFTTSAKATDEVEAPASTPKRTSSASRAGRKRAKKAASRPAPPATPAAAK